MTVFWWTQDKSSNLLNTDHELMYFDLEKPPSTTLLPGLEMGLRRRVPETSSAADPFGTFQASAEELPRGTYAEQVCLFQII